LQYRLATIAFESGDWNKAETYAAELLSEAHWRKSQSQYGLDIHRGNILLGRVALKSGNVEKAKAYLMAAGKTPGSPELNFSGPDTTLAKELLEKGEREAVIEYFQLCANFWEMGKERLEKWTATVKAGGMPDFETTLDFGDGRVNLAGTEASDFTLKDLDGKEVALKELRGTVVLLDFWASWCGPCRMELPHIEKLHREFKDKGLVVLGVNNEPPETARAFVKKKEYTFPTLVDADRGVANRYQVTGIPAVFVIDKDGKIVAHYVGLRSEADLRAALRRAGLSH